jgi:hypothetical protein
MGRLPIQLGLGRLFGLRAEVEFNIFQQIAVSIENFYLPFADFVGLNDFGTVGAPARRIDV